MSAFSARIDTVSSEPERSVVGDRYVVQRALGRGGMGEVLAVTDNANGKRLALKRLLPGAKPKYVMLLQREFHTLCSMQHPNVVQAFDYGMSDGVPYYTMELLAGTDVEATVPLPWNEVVAVVRDVASALSVLHARRLVHRDVSARNVWRTPEGTVKLIDFGTLATFGEASDIAGTPPYVAPEALRTRMLDQRTDIYALGALAYYLLTGRHAYPARALAELEQRWAQGVPGPAGRLAQSGRRDLEPIPEGLEQLIDGLMAAEPQGRPASAVEVLERLELILPGTSDAVTLSVEGVLASKAFVGRHAERKRVRALLKRAGSGVGASVALLGVRSIGRSRLLAEIAVEARVAGATVVSLAGDDDRTALSAATRATLHVLRALPALARSCAAPHATVLGHLSPELRLALGVEQDALQAFPELVGEARIRLQNALHAFWLAVAQERQVVILLDDLQAMDEASAALFAALGLAATNRQLLVMAAVHTEHEGSIPSAAQAFVQKSLVLPLGPLARDECTELLRSMFGDVAHLARTAQELSEKADGNPGLLVELCEHLVRAELIRCSDGAWVLPQEIPELAIPATRALLDQARLQRLSAEALSLARSLSIVDGAVSLELCSALSPIGAEQMFAALAELSRTAILTGGDDGYRFRSEAVRSSLRASSGDEEIAQAHAAAGEALLAKQGASLLDRAAAGLHLLRAGRSERGAAIVNAVAGDVINQLPEERKEIAQQLEQALGFLKKLSLSDAELLPILSVLSWSGYFVDRRFGFTYGDETLERAQRVCKMDLARRLRPWLGKKLGLYVALIWAVVALRRQARAGKLVPDFALAVRMLMMSAGSLAGMYTICIARKNVLASIAAMEPLTALGNSHIASIVHEFGLACAGTLSDRLGEASRRWQRLVVRLDDPRPIKELDDLTRAYYRAASLYPWGATECWRDRSRALEIADLLEAQPLELYHLSADQLRAVYCAQQGNVREAARHRARVELKALQRGMTWQVEIWEPSSSVSISARQYDAMSVKRAAGLLSGLSVDTPSLRFHMAGARASHLLLRGRHREALALLQELLSTRDPLLVGNANTVAQLAQAHNGLGQFAEARAACSDALAQLSPDDLQFPAMTLRLQVELALADSGLGQHEQAAARLDALLAQHTPNEGPLTLGALHEARASVALRAHQEDTAERHLEHMERWYRGTECPTLIQHSDRVAKRWTKSREGALNPALLPSLSFLAAISTKLTSTGASDLPETILTQVTRGALAAEGVLFSADLDAPPILAKSRSATLPDGLQAWAEQRMREALAYATQTEDSEGAEITDANVITLEGKTWRLFTLVSDDEQAERVVGAIALCTPLSEIPLDVLNVIARSIRDGREGALERTVELNGRVREAAMRAHTADEPAT
jgi:tetratricopeptide (TPR) repeat protein/tRNA A-37 threonylcarbamoyl transferase component Bud32